MDNEGPGSRVERTFWTVWYYISEAVSRLFRPESPNIVRNDPNVFQESAVDSEPAKCDHAEGDTSGREVDEEQPLATVSVLNSSQSVVAWELCTTDIDLGPEIENVQNKTQLSRGSESEEGEGTQGQWFAQTGDDHAGLLLTKEAKDEQEEQGVQKLYIHRRDETPEIEEHANTSSLRLTGDAMSEDAEESGRKADAEEETERPMTPDDLQKIDESMTEIQLKEEDDKTHQDQDLEVEDIEVKLCMITKLSLEEEDNMHIEEARVQRDEADTAVVNEEVGGSDGALLLASDNEKCETAEQAENQLSVCEELSDDDRDFEGDPGIASLQAESQVAYDKSGTVSEDELVVVGQDGVLARRGESDKDENVKMKEDEREQSVVIEEENVNETADDQKTGEVPEWDIKTVTEDSREEKVHTAEFTSGEQEDVGKDTKVQTKTRDTDKETHSEVINEKSNDNNRLMTITDISIDERLFDRDQAEEERLSSEVGDNERYVEVACTATSVTVKPEGETGQEISGGFKNIPLGICEGRLVVSRELNSPTCEETQEGVPEYNNESGPDENTTQRFLEVGDCEEFQTTPLPEEVESKEPESIENSGLNAEAEYLLQREPMEEEQESTGDIKNSFDLVVEEHAGILQFTDAGLAQGTEKPLVETAVQETGLLFEEGKLSVDSMKTGIEHSGNELEMHVGLTDGTDETTKELQDGTEELLVEFEIDEGLCDFKEADTAGNGHETTDAVAAEEVVGFTDEALKSLEAEVQEKTETSFFQEVNVINSQENSYKTRSLLEDYTESELLKQSVETEPTLLEDSIVEMQDAGIYMEETGYGVETAKDEMQSKNEMGILNLQEAGMTAELTTERNEKEDTLFAESESLETQSTNQLSDEAREINNEEPEAADESMTPESKDLTVISEEEMARRATESQGSFAEETVFSISGRQDVIEEEILDLWIQTALSEDTDDKNRQVGPESGQHMDTDIEPSNEEQNEISSVQREKDKEQLVESNSGESELVSDTEMSSSTAESGFLDQSLCEWGPQNSEAQPLKSTSPGSFQGMYDMLANVSQHADISEVSTQQPNSESQDILMEETAETFQSYLKEEESITQSGFHPDSGVTSPEARLLNQESDKAQERTGKESGWQKVINAEVTGLERETDWKDSKEADVKSLTEMSALFKVEETKVEDEPLGMTASDSPDEIEHADSGRSRSGSEASLQEGIASTESGSQGNTCSESEKLLKLPSLYEPRQSEEIVDSLPGLNMAEMAEQLTTDSEDQIEVDASVLDFTAQRSRIAVKNPRVRPPRDPRSLLHMPSLDPTPSSHLPVKVPAGVPLGGLGIGLKLPGLGAGFPVLKKTQRVVRDENSQETLSQEQETKPEEKSETPKQDEAQHKPKWMPPRHPGFGNPLMSELKTKLKKTTKE